MTSRIRARPSLSDEHERELSALVHRRFRQEHARAFPDRAIAARPNIPDLQRLFALQIDLRQKTAAGRVRNGIDLGNDAVAFLPRRVDHHVDALADAHHACEPFRHLRFEAKIGRLFHDEQCFARDS